MHWRDFSPSVRRLSVLERKRVEEAFRLCIAAHEGQKRKSGEPYATHPIAVAQVLAEWGADGDTLVAALLHDTIEDTPLTAQDLQKQFGASATVLIEGVTKLDDPEIRAHPTLDEEIESIRKIFTAMQEDARIMVIKLADRLHNMQTIRWLSDERQEALARETLDIYVKVAERMAMQDLCEELEILCIEVVEPTLARGLKRLRADMQQQGETVIAEFTQRIRTSRLPLPMRFETTYEHKTWRHVRKQLAENGKATGRSSITCVLLCDTIEGCYHLLGLLHQLWPAEVKSVKDFINAPAMNGYRGLHTTVITADGTRVRCKIRTRSMHAYARQGITTLCFDGKATSVTAYLPWGERISALARDTLLKSEEFWNSLQSDILGKTLVVYGPDDRSVQVPVGSTALDGAFHLFRDRTLKILEVRVNGEPVPFFTPLTQPVSIEATFGNTFSITREWLGWVRTGFATALIRSALGMQSTTRKIEEGKRLLEEAMVRDARGYLSEFQEESLLESLRSTGYSALTDIYIAIADGHLEPSNVVRILFPSRKHLPLLDSSRWYTMWFSLEEVSLPLLQQLLKMYESFEAKVKNLHIGSLSSGSQLFKLSLRSTPAQLERLQKEISILAGKPVEYSTRTWLELVLLGLIIFFWGINPVFAKWLLREGMPPLTLVTVRLIAYAVYSAIFYTMWRIFHRTGYSRIPKVYVLSFFSALGLFAMAAFTYAALVYMPPSVHLTLLRFNVLLLPIIPLIAKRPLPARPLIVAVGAFLIAMVIFLSTPSELPLWGVILSILTLCTFTVYSIGTETVLQRYKIGARYPYFLFLTGMMLGIVGLLLLPWQPAAVLLSPLTGYALVYVLFCVFIPYAAFHAVLKRMRFKYVTDSFLLEIPLAVLFEHLLLGISLKPPLYILLFGMIVLILFLRRNTVRALAAPYVSGA